MTRLLLLFSAHRELLVAKERAESEARIWQSRFEDADLRSRELADRLISNTEKTADVLAQQVLNRRLFSKADMAGQPERDPGVVSSFSVGRGVRQQKTAEARENFRKFFEGEINSKPV